MTSILKFQPIPATKTNFNGLFDEFFNRNITNFLGSDAVLNQPAVNVIESENAFKLEIAAPGFDKQDFNLNVENDFLIVAADVGEVHTVLDHGDDERADQGARHRAFATAQTGAADHDGGDDIQLIHLAVGGRSALEQRGRDHAAGPERHGDRRPEEEGEVALPFAALTVLVLVPRMTDS